MINVLIVDDHESVRDTLREMFERMEGFHVAGSIPSAAMAEPCCRRWQPDLVLMDVCTEGGASGLEAARAIKQQWPQIKIIVMSGFDEITYAPRARDIGAEGFVYKHRSLEQFREAVQQVLRGETVFPEPKTLPLPNGDAPLTEREMEVLRLLCKPMTTSEIATELFISESTVKYHKAQMLAKTGFTRSVDLAFYMITNGWINPRY